MTLVEFFDRIPVENIISSLALKPDKVVFVSPDSRKVIRAVPIYQKILEGRGIYLEMRVKSVMKNDLEGITEALYGIISDDDEEYVIDISGGDESALVAFGIVLGNTDKKIAAFRINAISRRGVWFDMRMAADGKRKIERTIIDFSESSQVYLTVHENVLLHGGKIYGESVTFGRDDPVCEDIDKLWQICRRSCGEWNSKINRLSAAVGSYSGEQGTYSLSEDDVGRKDGVDRALWQSFVDDGFVTVDANRSGRGLLVFTYKNKPVQDCLTQAGSLFEYYTYKTALACERDGVPVFDSATTGIILGWNEDVDTTRNEIDVMLMCGVIPVFISCKNGDVKTDELYKLATVAEKFGSSYARCALAATIYFDSADKAYNGDAAVSTLRGRADNMNVRVIGSIHRMEEQDFANALVNLTK